MGMKIKELKVIFNNEIIIPDEIVDMELKELKLFGKITDEGIKRIISVLPETIIFINGKKYN